MAGGASLSAALMVWGRRGSVRASTGRRVRRRDGSTSGAVLRQWRQWEGEVTRGGDHRRRHCAMVAGAVRRGDGMRVRVRASAVDGTRRGQVRSGPDSGAPRAQERPGGGGRGRAHAAGRRGTAGARGRGARSGLGGRAGNEREKREGGRPTGVERGRGSTAGRRSGAEREEGSSARGRRKEREGEGRRGKRKEKENGK